MIFGGFKTLNANWEATNCKWSRSPNLKCFITVRNYFFPSLVPALSFGLQKQCFFFIGSFFWFKPKKRTTIIYKFEAKS